MTASDSELVMLQGGLTVPLPALQILWSLESRGIGLEPKGELLMVFGLNGKPELSPDDVAAIKKYKFHLLALCAYQAPSAWQHI